MTTVLKGRRVGTFTLGAVLIAFGSLFMLRLVYPAFTFRWILSFWPLILVFLGIEVLIGYFVNKEEKMRYDAGAIAIVILLSCFSVGMAFTQYMAENLPQLHIYF